jgi:hypothetical protein
VSPVVDHRNTPSPWTISRAALFRLNAIYHRRRRRATAPGVEVRYFGGGIAPQCEDARGRNPPKRTGLPASETHHGASLHWERNTSARAARRRMRHNTRLMRHNEGLAGLRHGGLRRYNPEAALRPRVAQHYTRLAPRRPSVMRHRQRGFRRGPSGFRVATRVARVAPREFCVAPRVACVASRFSCVAPRLRGSWQRIRCVSTRIARRRHPLRGEAPGPAAFARLQVPTSGRTTSMSATARPRPDWQSGLEPHLFLGLLRQRQPHRPGPARSGPTTGLSQPRHLFI